MNDSLRQELFELETRLLKPEVRASADELTKLLSDEFVEIGSCGQVYNKQSIIEALCKESLIRIILDDFNAVQLATDIVLVTYHAIIFEGGKGDQGRPTLRSSIWKEIDGKWQMVFHQGTAILSK